MSLSASDFHIDLHILSFVGHTGHTFTAGGTRDCFLIDAPF